MRTVIISQARMTSTRLPGKVLKEVLGKPLLSYHIERLQRVTNADMVMVATTDNATDDPIVGLCRLLGVKCFRGSEEDVLARFYHAAMMVQAETIVRVTSDCPIIDPGVVETAIKYFLDNDFDYVSNTLLRSYPRGLDVEVFSFKVLCEAYNEATLPPEREHVTPYFYVRPEKYRLGNIVNNADNSKYRWTVDTIDDFQLIKTMLEYLYPDNPAFNFRDCLRAHAQHPHWLQINADVAQKKL